jgi:hypothetical protein
LLLKPLDKLNTLAVLRAFLSEIQGVLAGAPEYNMCVDFLVIFLEFSHHPFIVKQLRVFQGVRFKGC